MATNPVVTETPLDSKGNKILIGSTALVTDQKYYLFGYKGTVVDPRSTLFGGTLGPIAIFFDKNVPCNLLLNQLGAEKCAGKCPTPETPEKCENCPRIVCFRPEVLEVIDGKPTT